MIEIWPELLGSCKDGRRWHSYRECGRFSPRAETAGVSPASRHAACDPPIRCPEWQRHRLSEMQRGQGLDNQPGHWLMVVQTMHLRKCFALWHGFAGLAIVSEIAELTTFAEVDFEALRSGNIGLTEEFFAISIKQYKEKLHAVFKSSAVPDSNLLNVRWLAEIEFPPGLLLSIIGGMSLPPLLQSGCLLPSTAREPPLRHECSTAWLSLAGDVFPALKTSTSAKVRMRFSPGSSMRTKRTGCFTEEAGG